MAFKLMSARMGNYGKPHYYPTEELAEDMNEHLEIRGGYS
jgi:hypothetical protein